jgi:hypothetical protein
MGWLIKPHDERNAALLQVGFCVDQALHQKAKVASLCRRELIIQPKDCEHRDFEFIGQFNGVVQSGIISASLGPLHPIDNTLPLHVFRMLIGFADTDADGVGVGHGWAWPVWKELDG